MKINRGLQLSHWLSRLEMCRCFPVEMCRVCKCVATSPNAIQVLKDGQNVLTFTNNRGSGIDPRHSHELRPELSGKFSITFSAFDNDSKFLNIAQFWLK